MNVNIRKLVGALAMGAALVVPTLLPVDAQAQGPKGPKGRHDHGRHLGWDKQDRRDRDRWDRDRRDRDRRDRDRRERDRQRDWRAQEARRRDQDRWNQDRWDGDRRENDRRQQTKNQWRNLAYVGGAAGLYGILTKNKTIAALGLGGGLYSLYRYEQDRKSQNRDARNRYDLFRRSSFDYNGHRYERRLRNQNGQRYYYFARTR